MQSLGVVSLILATAGAMFACATRPLSSSSAPNGEELAAEVLGQRITLAELDERIRRDLFAPHSRRERDRLFELRSDALDRMIDERVSAQRIAADSPVAHGEASEADGVTDEQVAGFWEANRAGMGAYTFEQLAPQIRRFLERKRRSNGMMRSRNRPGVIVHLVAPRIEIAAAGPARGPVDARVTMIEFADFQCPYCRQSLATIERVLDRYPREVRLIFRHFPIDALHPRAHAAAEAAACASEQDAFWPYHDRLFANSESVEKSDLLRYATDLGLDVAIFESCIDERRSRSRVESDLATARELELSGTPSFVINGILISGSKSAEDFFQIIDQELKAEGPPAERH